MAPTTAARSVVGATSMRGPVENASSPSWIPDGSAVAKFRAPCWAAARRLGATSPAIIEPEVSSTRMTVARWRGVRMACAGWAKPTINSTRAAMRAAVGRWRCQPGRRGATDASMPTLVKRTAVFCRARCAAR